MERVAVIGMGGIGSHLMYHVNQLCGAEQFKNYEFTIFDDDTIEPKNLAYQHFLDEHMGLAKVAAIDAQCWMIPRLILKRERADAKTLANDYSVVISCVDSAGWRRDFFSTSAEKLKYWIDLRSEGRTVAAYTKHKKNTKEALLATVSGSNENSGSCQLKFELDKGIIQAGNRIIALVGVQFLLNYYNSEANMPSFNQRF